MKNIQFSWKKTMPYILSFGIPFILLSCLLLFYNSGFGNPVPNTMDVTLIVWNGLASLCFYTYLTHSHNFKEYCQAVQLLFSFAYGLSAYCILQEYSYNILCIYALFPLLFCFFEKTVNEKKYALFIMLSAIIIILDPQTAIPVFLLLTILFIMESALKGHLSVSEFAHYISGLTVAVLLSGFRLFPHVAQSLATGNSYRGFSFNYSPLIFISRLLPFNIASSSFFSSNGMDLYFGILFLFLCLLYFCTNQHSAKEKIYYGLFFALIILSIEVTPVQYLFNLCTSYTSSSISYDFILIFWCLFLALKTIPHLKHLRRMSFFVSCILYYLPCTVSLLFSAHNFHILALQSVFLFSALVTGILAIFCFAKKEGHIYSHLLFGIVILELFCNAYISTNQDFIPSSRALFPQCAITSDNTDDITTTIVDINPISDQEYSTFIANNTDEKLYHMVNNLTLNVDLNDRELEKYTSTLLPNNFEYTNAICKKLGYSEDLFIPAEDIRIQFAENDNYIITPISNNIYNIQFRDTSVYPDTCIVPFTIVTDKAITENLHFYNDYTEQLLTFDSKEINTETTCYISVYPQQYFTINMQMLFYYINPAVYNTLDDTYVDYLKNQPTNSSNIGLSDYLGLAASFLGLIILFLLFFNSDKEKVHRFLLSVKAKINTRCHFPKLTTHIRENYVYYLAFFIPIMLFIFTMIIFDCVPFGPNSFFDEDGLCLTLPSTIDTYYNLQKQNTYVSLNGGYGFSLYAMNPLANTARYLLLLSPSQIAPFLLFTEAICLGICGFSVVFYLTHRLSGKRAYKKDFRLLIPAMIYTLNTYMLAMHGFTSWYYTLMALPLLFLALDYLMYRKKTFFYVLLLAYCIITNLYHALYICIFLVLFFFTYHFDSLKDFVQKGFRFAWTSILAALNSFFIISNTLLASYDSPYQEKDSIFPSFGFHTNFFNQWKNHMLFSESCAVTENNGYVSIYCGILTLLLVVIFVTSKKLSKHDKIKKLCLLIIMYLSFNGEVLSYIWNGFHYQSKVPNRYVFLLLFLLAIWAYDGIRLIPTIKLGKLLTITGIGIVFFTVCQFCGEGNTLLAYISTIIFICVYALIILCQKRFAGKYTLSRILVLLFIFEITLNMLFTTGNYSLNSILLYGDYEAETEFIHEKLKTNNEFIRITYPSSSVINCGQVYNIGSNSLFNSFVSQHQVNANYIFGFYYGTNNISSNYSSTPVGQSLIGSRYIYLPVLGNMPIEDMGQYNYIGCSDDYYIFENPDALSLGYYVPYDIDYIAPTIGFPPNFYNALASLYLGNNAEQLFDSYYVEYSEQLIDNSFAFSNPLGDFVDFETANDIYQAERKRTNCNPISALKMHFNLIPEKSGEAYLYSFEFVSLGQVEANVKKKIEIAYPNPISEFREAYNYVILNENVKDAFLSAMKQNQLENISIANNTISGTTNYPEAGYTMLSLACDRNWHAYIDGKEVEILDNFNSFMLIETPAGAHTLELKYVPYGMKVSKAITYSCWFLTLAGYGTIYLIKRKKKQISQ
ncbi:MAG: YfhO family protein [Lachnospiraceae bacterium]|nr:YfhO family protein [Lachnospiraceae bacterium]